MCEPFVDTPQIHFFACPSSSVVLSSTDESQVYWPGPLLYSSEPVLLRSSHSPGDKLPLGRTSVQYTATAKSNMDIQGSCVFNITVVDQGRSLDYTDLCLMLMNMLI